MCKIEEIAAELERTGACEAWFKDCDAKVKKVCVMPFGAHLLVEPFVSLGRRRSQWSIA